VLAVLGLAFLLFVAGLEIDLRSLRRRTLRAAGLGYVVTLVPLLMAIALSATSLGLVVAVLKDAGQEHSAVGQATIAGGTVADFAAIVLLTLFFSGSGREAGSTLVLLVVFAGLVVLVGLVLTRAGRSMHLETVLVRLQDTTAEIRVRLSVQATGRAKPAP
jgi:Kef-type K+ transport system membrane component KefB